MQETLDLSWIDDSPSHISKEKMEWLIKRSKEARENIKKKKYTLEDLDW
ncbi:MAG: hypothetical protein ACE5FT_00325 [Candidatus Nanoarchaeia archaeon]